jgi:hypothetical protein
VCRRLAPWPARQGRLGGKELRLSRYFSMSAVYHKKMIAKAQNKTIIVLYAAKIPGFEVWFPNPAFRD